jgi:hypothetical protein
MTLTHFFNKSIVVKRLQTVSGNKKNMVSTGTIEAHIQKITDEPSFQIYGVLGATHKAWCDVSTDIKEGDTVIDPEGNSYSVVATNKQDFGINVHLEVILKRYGA